MTALEAIARIESLIDGVSGGSADPEATKQIEEALGALSVGLPPSAQRDKLADIRHWADVYFSTRKWRAYPGGIRDVAIWVHQSCRVLRASVLSAEPT